MPTTTNGAAAHAAPAPETKKPVNRKLVLDPKIEGEIAKLETAARAAETVADGAEAQARSHRDDATKARAAATDARKSAVNSALVTLRRERERAEIAKLEAQLAALKAKHGN